MHNQKQRSNGEVMVKCIGILGKHASVYCSFHFTSRKHLAANTSHAPFRASRSDRTHAIAFLTIVAQLEVSQIRGDIQQLRRHTYNRYASLENNPIRDDIQQRTRTIICCEVMVKSICITDKQASVYSAFHFP